MILLSGAGLGFNKSRELGNRKKHLEMLMRMIILLKGEIRYGNTSLYDAFTGAAGKLEGKYREFFLNTAEENPLGKFFATVPGQVWMIRILPEKKKRKSFPWGRDWDIWEWICSFVSFSFWRRIWKMKYRN